MKPFLSFLFLLIFISCKHPGANSAEKQPAKNKLDTTKPKVEEERPLTKDDSTVVTIYAKDVDTLSYTNYELKKILEYYPELNENYPDNPNEAYNKKASWKEIEEPDRDKGLTFNSEVGKDNYYMLYGYFLKKKNGRKIDDTLRQKLITAFRDINFIHAYLLSGGTYFEHQYKRIIGYAEYGVYCYNDEYTSKYSIVPQKRLFIASLRQYVYDEVNNDNVDSLSPNDKKERIKDIKEFIDDLDILINNQYLLRQVQQFEYSFYNF